MNIKFSILITTKNRLSDLKITLANLSLLINREDVELLLYDDASSDDTVGFLETHYPQCKLFKNPTSLGLIHNRNVLLNNCSGEYAISLDDDAHFLSENVLENITDYFEAHSQCGVIACRIFWGKQDPISTSTNEGGTRVKGFVGCGHVWKMKAWRAIPNYPEWFVFYGEEDFASFHLFEKQIEIHYVPQILVHHRVDLKSRKKNQDYIQRTRRSLRSGWYLYFMFYPLREIPKKLLYSLYAQIKTKTLTGDFKATLGILQAIFDLLINSFKIYKNANRLNYDQYIAYQKLTETKLYWNPEE